VIGPNNHGDIPVSELISRGLVIFSWDNNDWVSIVPGFQESFYFTGIFLSRMHQNSISTGLSVSFSSL
jgi:hypothetical protein